MKTTVLLVVLLFTCVSAQVTQQLYANIQAYFSNTEGTNLISYCTNEPNKGQQTCTAVGYAVPPAAQARWGQPASTTDPSGLGFDPQTNAPITLSTGTGTSTFSDFFLGTLYHFNWAVFYAANATRLNLDFTLKTSTGSVIAVQSYQYRFLVDETINRTPPPCPYPSTTPCSDKISFINGGFDFSKSFTFNQVNYTLQLLGFRETQLSSSTPISYFISQENQDSIGYLFGRLQLACPGQCKGGGSFVTTTDGQCICDCTHAANCTYPSQVYASDCSCICPASATCTNGGTQNPDCSCNCPACPYPKVPNATCGCKCPVGFCGGCGNLVSDTPNCTCDCGQCPICQGANFVFGQDCGCKCIYSDSSCQAINSKYVEDPRPSVCACVCNNATKAACTGKFVLDPTSCNCNCPTDICPNSQTRFANNCTCGDCSPTGNWKKDPVTGLCTVCGLSAANCSSPLALDSTLCQCVCETLTCDTFNYGLVIDTTKFCACRNCTAGECICGNGKVEPGEQCEAQFVGDPCCVNCQFTTATCSDGNACTTNDVCVGNGTCVGTYKCGQSNDCRNITCDPNIGTCVQNTKPDGSACGADIPGLPGQKDLCSRQCSAGFCTENVVFCTDPISSDCVYPVCDPTSGLCTGTANQVDNSTCSDSNDCTYSDHCVSGVCQGYPKECDQDKTNPCVIVICLAETGTCAARPLSGNINCNADNNECTVGDQCSKGICLPGPAVQCQNPEICTSYVCNPNTGVCDTTYTNSSCNDNNICTENDVCNNGNCAGNRTDATSKLPACGYIPPTPPSADPTIPIVVITVSTAAALIGAIIGAAFLIKKIRDSRLMDPDTWNPDTFSSVGANPLYKGSITSVDNRLYEGKL